MKKLFVAILSLIFITSVSAKVKTYDRTDDNMRVRDNIDIIKNKKSILDTPSVLSLDKVYDFAEIYRDTQINSIKARIDKFIRDNQYDLAVATISKNPKESVISYADDFYWYNDFGVDEDHSGFLILIDLDNQKGYVGTYGRVKADNYDIKLSTVEIENEISRGEYFNATMHLIDLVEKSINKGLHDKDIVSTKWIASKSFYSFIPYIILVAIILTCFTMLIIITRHDIKYKRSKTKKYLVRDTLKIYNKK